MLVSVNSIGEGCGRIKSGRRGRYVEGLRLGRVSDDYERTQNAKYAELLTITQFPLRSFSVFSAGAAILWCCRRMFCEGCLV